MRFTLKNRFSAIALLATVLPSLSAQPAVADSAFVTQAAKGSFAGHSLISTPVIVPTTVSYVPPRGGATQQTPETTVPASGGNYAGTLEMGKNNFVLQAQAGAGNRSNVGILGGAHDTVGIFQHGQGLVSNLALVGVKGLTVDVIQPPGTAPVNMLIAKLPNGTFDIVQPKGAPPVNLIRVPSGLLVFRR